MDIENQEAIYCEDGRPYRVYCDICDKHCIGRFYKNHLKSQTLTVNIRKKEKNDFKYSFIYQYGLLMYCIR